MNKPIAEGPIEGGRWPKTLAARVVTPGPEPKLLGYDVQRDLVKNYSFIEMVWLAVTGELAEAPLPIKVFEVVLGYLAPVSMAQAPAHAAGLSRICGSKPSAVVSVAALTLAEQGRVAWEDRAALWAWLEGTGDWPDGLQASQHEGPSVTRLGQDLADLGYTHPIFQQGAGLVSACLAVLYDLGLKQQEQIISTWVWCRLPYVSAEAFAAKPGALADYPMNMPEYVYESPDE